jgi:hypothetical protein
MLIGTYVGHLKGLYTYLRSEVEGHVWRLHSSSTKIVGFGSVRFALQDMNGWR